MTIQELIDHCVHNKISFDTQIALRAKDDYLLVADNISLDNAYFGNCDNGSDLIDAIAPRDADGDIMYDNVPHFLILGNGR